MTDYFNKNKNESAPTTGAGFDINAMMGVRSTSSNTSEQAAKVLEEYNKLAATDTTGYPYKMEVLKPSWLGDKELIVLYLEAAGKVAITPILFGAELVESEVPGTKERISRAASYNVTKRVKRSKEDLESWDETKSTSKFLTLTMRELQRMGKVGKLKSYDASHLDLSGCIVVKSNVTLNPFQIISVATSELRSGIWGLHGTNTFSFDEPDLNHLNHTKVTNVVDLTSTANATDVLGNNIFSPLLVRISHYRTDELSDSGSKQLSPKIEINGYLDFRPLTPEEVTSHITANKQPPLLVPQFVITGLNNCANEGVMTPCIVLDSIAGIGKFAGDGLVTMFDQAAQYATTIDPSCSTYDWNQLSVLLMMEFAKRGGKVGIPTAMDPSVLLTGTERPSPVQRNNGYLGAFGELEILVDVPQSGEMAKVRQQLFGNLNYYHHKLTGVKNTVVSAIGAGGLVPQGMFTRVSETAQTSRDVREQFNALSLIAKFSNGTSGDANQEFAHGMQHVAGNRIMEGATGEREYRERVNYVSERLCDDGSYVTDSERNRVVISRPYVTQLIADLDSNQVKFEMRNSGADLINRITATVANTQSIDFDSSY